MSFYPGVDQFGRSPDLGSGGHRFKSCYSDYAARDNEAGKLRHARRGERNLRLFACSSNVSSATVKVFRVTYYRGVNAPFSSRNNSIQGRAIATSASQGAVGLLMRICRNGRRCGLKIHCCIACEFESRYPHCDRLVEKYVHTLYTYFLNNFLERDD